MTIDRLLPQVEALARSGLGWEDVMVKLRINDCNKHVVRRAVLEMSNAEHQRASAIRSDGDAGASVRTNRVE